MSHYVHSIPGRLRVRSRAFRNRPDNAETARNLLDNLAGVHSIEANTITGSLLIRYDEGIVSATRVLRALVAEGLIQRLPSPEPTSSPTKRSIAPRWSGVTESLSEALLDAVADVLADKLARRAAVALVRAVV